jgi:hypothetical protein
VASNASILVVLRPAQIMTSPVAQMLPTEVATAAGRQYLGIDPADVDEVVLFGDPSNMLAPSYGAVFKFNKPFRAINLVSSIRAGAKKAEFNGKTYLQNGVPLMPSFYGPNNKTLIMAPDATLRQVVQAVAEPKSGPLMDRVRDVPSGSDLYAFINVANLKDALPMLANFGGPAIPPDKMQMLQGVSAVEMNVNLATRGPLSCVVHCTDDAAAQQLEMMLNAMNNGAPQGPVPGAPEPPAISTPASEAMAQYWQRMKQKFQPQRNGTSITVFRIEADDPLQPQLLGMVVGAAMSKNFMPQLGGMQPPMMPGGMPAGGMPAAGPEGFPGGEGGGRPPEAGNAPASPAPTGPSRAAAAAGVNIGIEN